MPARSSARHPLIASMLHIGLGFAAAASLWALDALPGVPADRDLAQLHGAHAQEDTAAVARALAGD